MNNSKIKTAVVLYEETCKYISTNSENWQEYLKSSCHNYKLRFDEKILIFRQKPDARAVLELKNWSKYFGRLVAKGSKGIFVFTHNNPEQYSLKHYFDISDTIPTENARNVPIWEVNSENISIVKDYFKSNYKTNDIDDIAIMVQEAVRQEVLVFFNSNINSDKKMTEFIKENLFELSVNSSALTIMERLSINSKQYFYNEDFNFITQIKTKEALNAIGNIIDNTSKKILGDISMHLSLHNRREINYDRTDLQTGRRLSNSERNSRNSEIEGQVRQTSSEVSSKSQGSRVHQSTDFTDTQSALGNSTGRSDGKNNPISGTDEESTRDNRRTKNSGYDGLGRENERDTSLSRRNSPERTNIHLTKEETENLVKTKSVPLLTIEEQKEIIKTEEKNSSVFSVSKEIEDRILQKGSGFVDGKLRIYHQFKNSFDLKENAKFLKDEYGIGGSYPAVTESNINYNLDSDSKGLTICVDFNENKKITFNWDKVAKKISNLIKEDNYLNPKEKEAYSEWQIKQESKQNKIINDNPVSQSDKYSFNVGDKVYLYSTEYEILAIDDKSVTLFDVEFPLMNTEMDRSVFNNEVFNSTSNDHLKIKVDNLSTSSKKEKEDTFQIYQIKSDEELTELRFSPYDRVKDNINPQNYIQVYSAPLSEHTKLEDIFRIFNSDERPKNFYGHSLSVSDIVVLNRNEEITANYVDRFGFKRVEVFEKALTDNIDIEVLQTNDVYGEYLDIYSQNSDSIIAFQVGEFYEFWEKSATFIQENFEHIPTSRKVNGLDIDMVGVPKSRLPIYIEKTHNSNKEFIRVDVDTNENVNIERLLPKNTVKPNIRPALQQKKNIKLMSASLGDTYVTDARKMTFNNEYITCRDNGTFILCGDSTKSGTTTKDVQIRTFSDADEVIKYLLDNNIEPVGYSVEAYIPVADKELYREINLETAISMHEHNFSVFRADGSQVVFDDEFWDNPAPYYQCKIDEYEQNKTIDFIANNIDELNSEFSNVQREEGEPYFLYLDDNAENYSWNYDEGKTAYQNTANLIISNEFEPIIDYLNTAIEELEHNSEYSKHHIIAVDTLTELNNYISIYSSEENSSKTNETVIETTTENNKEDIIIEKPIQEKINFVITDDKNYSFAKKDKFRNNIDAIITLQQIKKENRLATPEEQVTLSKYVGWGGLSEAFDKNNTSWKNEYNQLLELLTDKEYSNARASTLSAFYTPQKVVQSIYKGLENLGFTTGNILEPSCGTGNFIGSLPDTMKNSKVVGVEIDNISADIAKQLYQKSTITHSPFEKTNLPDNFFDVVVGNVPFGDFKVNDKRYDKNNYLIHDYFFAKSLDKLTPNGVMALVTSKGTMDKQNPSFRKYLSQRADLLGAIRLPTSTFKNNAGTEVTSDILFLQKKERISTTEADWVYLGEDENGITMNSYFVEHPEMIIGKMEKVSGRFGEQTECILNNTAEFENRLNSAISNIKTNNVAFKNNIDEVSEEIEADYTIPAEPDVRNFSYTVVDNKLFFRENSLMTRTNVNATAEKRIRGMIEIRDCLRTLMEYQKENYSEEYIKKEQNRLNTLYDKFKDKYGIINSRANKIAMCNDTSYYLLTSLEVTNENNEFIRKADIFTKRTINAHKIVTSCDTSSEALAISIGEKACVDIEYMQQLTGKTEEEIYSDLQGVIFLNPEYQKTSDVKYINADEYLSGNVRDKLNTVKNLVKEHPEYKINEIALEKIQPEELKASEISVRLGSTWIEPSDIDDFIYETLDTPRNLQNRMYSYGQIIKTTFVEHTGEWNISSKSADSANIKVYNTYGTERVSAYKIIEETLNLKDVRVFDYVENEEGKPKAVLNKEETTLAQSKQEIIKQKFVDWIWSKPERRERLCKKYNQLYNSNRTREYDGSHITFSGMNAEITLKPHQINAIARILYGGNTLLAHCVGAGKTFEMVAAAQESKRLGLCNKSLFVVPNHLTEQWATEYLQLYPSANILVATKKDFETKNRKKFCSRIATGEFDAVIIGHSQFEKIPLSFERQQEMLQTQIDEIIIGIENLKDNNGENYSIKAMERTKKGLENKLEKLNDQSRKDDVVTFEELGIDRIFVDESHYYKNLYLYTKMRNVGGIAQTEAQKSSDLYMKCRYLDEITGGKGVIFATGTPISNSMVELYTIQRYLQYDYLVSKGLQHFDSWASTFGETVTAIELNPEGSGYRAKTRFAKFFNLPELMTMFRDVADIQTADMLNLPVPKANFHNVVVAPSELQLNMVDTLSERADKVRNKLVDNTEDNMLKITNDGRKLALDQRMVNDELPDFENSKVNACANNVYQIWKDGMEDKTTQLVFCDLSTPNNKDKKFNVYDDIKAKLIDKGVPENEIQFIHSANSEAKKKELFSKVRNGEVRVLIGSTAKMGAGTNVQDRLIASHDLDCPWRPSDLEQRLGRTVRQGNKNEEVEIFRYVTEKTFDAYLYQLVEGKQRFASQIMTSKTPVRIAEDIDETSLSYAEIKMLATGNPLIQEKMDLDIQVQKLNLVKSNYLSTKFDLEDKVLKYYPQEILKTEGIIKGMELDVDVVKNNPKSKEDFVGMTINGKLYSDKKDAGLQLIKLFKEQKIVSAPKIIGNYRGFEMELRTEFKHNFQRVTEIWLKNNLSHYAEMGVDVYGNIQRLDNVLDNLEKRLEQNKDKLDNLKKQLENAKIEITKPFEFEAELTEKTQRLYELNALLNVDENTNNEKSFYQEVTTEAEKDLLISNGFDNYITKDGNYIFKVANSDKTKVSELLNCQDKKLCV